MLKRTLYSQIVEDLKIFPAVAILGCRQVGKTTLAHQVQKQLKKPVLYFDLELLNDRAKFSNPQLMLEQHSDKLLILDEIQHVPEIFAVIRGLIDRRRRNGDKTGHYLILGSASPRLLKQNSESLAGRIAYLELPPLNLLELNKKKSLVQSDIDKLWLRGGLPDSFLSSSNKKSMLWRQQFINTYLERDLQKIGSFPADRIHRLWKMLAYDQGALLNASRLASSLVMSVTSVHNYLEIMSGLFLIRFLRPWSGNSKKRLVKAPKVYVRDSGILHALTNLNSLDDIVGHSICGLSWEGFVIEQILQILPFGVEALFYRSSAGAEIDLILQANQKKILALEIKRTSSPVISKGFKLGCEEIKATKRYYIIPHGEAFPLDKQTTAIGLPEFLKLMAKLF